MSKSTKVLNFLTDVYLVGRAAFRLNRGAFTVKKLKGSLVFLADVYFVGKTAFRIRYVEQSRKRASRHSNRSRIARSLAKLAELLAVISQSLGLIRLTFNFGLSGRYIKVLQGRFFKLNRVNQGIIIGCILIISASSTLPVWFINWQNHLGQSAVQQSMVEPYSAPQSSISGKPVSIKIPSLQIDLPVIEGRYDPKTHNWTLTNDNAQYMVDSAKPNNVAGKTFIYGHALRNIFGRLPSIQPGAKLSIVTNNGYRFDYRFESSFATSPSDLSVLDNTKNPVLYVQTCSGVFYQNRQIFSFDYIGYEKLKA